MTGRPNVPEDLLAGYRHLLSAAARRRDHSTGQEAIEANKRLVSRVFLEIVNRKDYDVAVEVFAPDFEWAQTGLRGPEGFVAWARAFHAGWPDVQDRIELQVAEGEMVVTLVTVHGTHAGPWLGLAPTGRRFAFPAVGIDRVRDGRIVERSATFDFAAVLRGLGVRSLPDDAPPPREG